MNITEINARRADAIAAWADLIERGISPRQAQRTLGVSEVTIRRWRKHSNTNSTLKTLKLGTRYERL